MLYVASTSNKCYKKNIAYLFYVHNKLPTCSSSTIHTEINSAHVIVEWSADDVLQLKECGRNKCRGLNDFQSYTNVHQYDSVQQKYSYMH